MDFPGGTCCLLPFNKLDSEAILLSLEDWELAVEGLLNKFREPPMLMDFLGVVGLEDDVLDRLS